MEFERIRAVRDDLEQKGMSRNTGMVGMISMSTLLSLIPGIGGPASYLVDKLGTKLFEPDLVAHITALSDAILAIEPALARLEDHGEAIERITAILQANPALDTHIRPIVAAGAATALDAIELHNNGGIQNVVDVVLRNLHIEATTARGGTSDFRGVDHEGTARFSVEPGSTQTITGSSFTGRTGSVTSQVVHNGTATNHGATQEYNVTRNGVTAAQRTIVETTDGSSRIGMSIGRNGIEYGKKTDR